MNLNAAQKEAFDLIATGHYTGEDLRRKMGTDRFKAVCLEDMKAEGIIKWQGEYWVLVPLYLETTMRRQDVYVESLKLAIEQGVEGQGGHE